MSQEYYKHRQRVFEGERFDIDRLHIEGSDGQLHVREVIRHPGAVVLLPLIDDDHLVMIENRRPTVAATLLELPAGTRDPDEPFEATAARELVEETGYEAGSLRRVHTFYSAPGISDEVMQLFVATELTPRDQRLDAVEQITPRIVTRDEADTMIREDRVADGKTLVGLYFWLSR